MELAKSRCFRYILLVVHRGTFGRDQRLHDLAGDSLHQLEGLHFGHVNEWARHELAERMEFIAVRLLLHAAGADAAHAARVAGVPGSMRCRQLRLGLQLDGGMVAAPSRGAGVAVR